MTHLTANPYFCWHPLAYSPNFSWPWVTSPGEVESRAGYCGLGREVDSASFGPQYYTAITPQITPQTCLPFWEHNLNVIVQLGRAKPGHDQSRGSVQRQRESLNSPLLHPLPLLSWARLTGAGFGSAQTSCKLLHGKVKPSKNIRRMLVNLKKTALPTFGWESEPQKSYYCWIGIGFYGVWWKYLHRLYVSVSFLGTSQPNPCFRWDLSLTGSWSLLLLTPFTNTPPFSRHLLIPTVPSPCFCWHLSHIIITSVDTFNS